MRNIANVLGTNWHGDQVLIGAVTELSGTLYSYCALCYRTERCIDYGKLCVGCTQTVEAAVALIVAEYERYGIDRAGKPKPPPQPGGTKWLT